MLGAATPHTTCWRPASPLFGRLTRIEAPGLAGGMARLWAAAVLLSLCALVPASDCLFNPETADELSREPVWNSGAWVVDKLYFSTWAHFQACVSDEAAIATLDELRARVQGEYFPVNNGRSAWDLFQDRQAVAPAAANETVLDLVWPYQRNHLKHARPMCVPGAEPDVEGTCCCKARATWGLYARFESERDALWVHQQFQSFKDWESTWCIGLESSGVDAEMMDASGYISRRTLDSEATSQGSRAGAIVGGIFGALAFIALVVGGVFLWRRHSQPAFAEWTADDNPMASQNSDEYP
eukprot:jgi/Tetstr1/428008/TSEL_018081.t1